MERPDPDSLLHEIEKNEAKEKRGTLKIFFGMAAGVGKTCAMLRAAHRLKSEGVDVVVGYVETHKRAETESLVQGLEIIERARLDHRGVTMEDMDTDAILKRRPSVVLVDELAHTNPPGYKHPKRYRDVRELIENGINVFTTLNVQHLESQADAVQRATGIPVRETIPDSVIDEADEIELIDLPPDDLIKRMTEGKIYGAQKIGSAISNFFKRENLEFLRELSLDYTAQIVGQGLKDADQSSGGVLAVISHDPENSHILRKARLLAFHRNAPWFAVYVDVGHKLSDSEQIQLEKNVQLAQELGGEIIMAPDTNPTRAILSTARRKRATGILIAGTKRSRFSKPTPAQELAANYANEFDIHLIAVPEAKRSSRFQFKWFERTSGWGSYANAIQIVGITTVLNLAVESLTGYWTLSLIYLLAVLFAGTKLSRGPALLTGALSALLWDYLFIPPKYTLSINKFEDFLMFSLFFIVAVATGNITSQLRAKQKAMLQRETRIWALFELTRSLSRSVDIHSILDSAADNVEKIFECDCVIVMSPNAEFDDETPQFGCFELNEKERGVAGWVIKNKKAAGRYSDTLPQSEGYYEPLLAPSGIVGVMGLKSTQVLTLEKKTLLQTMANLIAISLERANLSEDARSALVAIQSEKMYEILLNSLSHELRTPLTSITGAVSSLIDTEAGKGESKGLLLEEIRESAAILNRLVGNLLDMSRFQGGHVKLRSSELDIHELVESALRRITPNIAGHDFKNELLLDTIVTGDFSLLDQVFYNVFLNAVNHTPAGTQIRIHSRVERNHEASRLVVFIDDNGPGVRDAERVFDKFYRGPNPSEAGAGLGLTVCRAIIEAHGGSMRAENIATGGARFVIELPMDEK